MVSMMPSNALRRMGKDRRWGGMQFGIAPIALSTQFRRLFISCRDSRCHVRCIAGRKWYHNYIRDAWLQTGDCQGGTSVLRYFFTHRNDLPPGISTPNGSWQHLALLISAAITHTLIFLYYRRQDLKVRKRIKRFIAWFLVIGDTSHLVWVTATGNFSWNEMLPIHLCSIAVVFTLVAELTEKDIYKEFCYACGIPGAVAALLTPDWSAYYVISFQYLQSASSHIFLILMPVLWIWGDGFRPDVRRLPRCLGLLLVFAGISAMVNSLLGANYMFLSYAPKHTILETYEALLGDPGYILLMVLTIFALWTILYVPWIIAAGSARRPSCRRN